MKRIMGIGLMGWMMCAPLVHAQEVVGMEDFRLAEVEVTAAGLQTRHELQVIAQIDHEQLEQLPITNISDILAFLPGIDVRSRGASNAQVDITLRGGTFDQVSVLLNGIPFSDAQTGHYSMNLPVSPTLIERIEILQPTSIDHSSSLCGAINIITRQTASDQYTLQLTAGTQGEVSPTFVGSWARKQTHVNVSAEYARSEGYYAPTSDAKEKAALSNTDYQLANIYAQVRRQGLDAQVGAQYKDAGLGTGYGYASIDQFDATRTLLASVRYHWSPAKHWLIGVQASYRGNYDRYEWHRGTTSNKHWTHNTHAALEAKYHSIAGQTRMGVEVKDEYIRSTNMGEHNRIHATLTAGHTYVWAECLKASLQIAGHYNSWYGWYGSGAAEIAYSFLRTGIVSLSATRSLRMPTWTDMYYKAGVQRGSTSLKAEQAWTLSLNAQYTFDWQEKGALSLQGDVYHRWGTDIIDWTYDTKDSLFHATNQNEVNTFGIEIGASYRLNKWLRELRVQYAYTDLSLDLASTKSNYLDHLRHKFVCSLTHGIYVWKRGCVGANWSLRWQDRAGTYVDIYGTPGNAYTPVLLLDGYIYMECAHVRVSAGCTNMTNRHYYNYGGILQPGAQGRISVTAKL